MLINFDGVDLVGFEMNVDGVGFEFYENEL